MLVWININFLAFSANQTRAMIRLYKPSADEEMLARHTCWWWWTLELSSSGCLLDAGFNPPLQLIRHTINHWLGYINGDHLHNWGMVCIHRVSYRSVGCRCLGSLDHPINTSRANDWSNCGAPTAACFIEISFWSSFHLVTSSASSDILQVAWSIFNPGV